jgi:hypothetical protein
MNAVEELQDILAAHNYGLGDLKACVDWAVERLSRNEDDSDEDVILLASSTAESETEELSRKIVRRYLPPDALNEEMLAGRYVRKLFSDAGWYPGRKTEIGELSNKASDAEYQAMQLLREYGGLSVGAVGAGRECAASDIRFYERPSVDQGIVGKRWERKLGKLVAVAAAQREHITVLVDGRGQFYIFTDPDGKLYAGGTFQNVTSTLLLGLHYGAPIPAPIPWWRRCFAQWTDRS